jgi:hypothetical protein
VDAGCSPSERWRRRFLLQIVPSELRASGIPDELPPRCAAPMVAAFPECGGAGANPAVSRGAMTAPSASGDQS